MTGVDGTRESFASVWGPYLVVGLLVAALVLGAIAFAVLRYRVRAGRPARGDGGRPGWLGRLELACAVVIAIVVAGLLTLTFRSQSEISALGSDTPAATVDVTAFQWGWRFDYGSGVVVIGNGQRIPTLIVPTGELVRFNLTSRDVIHSFWIPEQRFKRDALPGRESSFGLVFDDTPGEGRCAEFCGIDHYRMDFHMLPVSPSSFRSWLAGKRSAPTPRASA